MTAIELENPVHGARSPSGRLLGLLAAVLMLLPRRGPPLVGRRGLGDRPALDDATQAQSARRQLERAHGPPRPRRAPTLPGELRRWCRDVSDPQLRVIAGDAQLRRRWSGPTSRARAVDGGRVGRCEGSNRPSPSGRWRSSAAGDERGHPTPPRSRRAGPGAPTHRDAGRHTVQRAAVMLCDQRGRWAMSSTPRGGAARNRASGPTPRPAATPLQLDRTDEAARARRGQARGQTDREDHVGGDDDCAAWPPPGPAATRADRAAARARADVIGGPAAATLTARTWQHAGRPGCRQQALPRRREPRLAPRPRHTGGARRPPRAGRPGRQGSAEPAALAVELYERHDCRAVTECRLLDTLPEDGRGSDG